MRLYYYRTYHSIIGFDAPIRSREDLVLILIRIIQLINSSDFNKTDYDGREDVELLIAVDKMSRVFISYDRSIHSLHFPFRVREESGKLHIEHNGIEIDGRMLAIVERASTEPNIFEKPIDALVQLFWDSYEDLFFVSLADQAVCWNLFRHFMSYEAGYLRYDYDEEHQNGRIHPLHHIDLNFANGGKFKLGVDSRLLVDDLIDLVNTNTECRYLRDCTIARA